MPIIVARELSKIYGEGENRVCALEGVNISINKGEFVSVVGQSGSGKSTLMNIFGCLDTPSSGEYYLNGENVCEKTDRQLAEIRSKQIGFVFQGFNLIRSLTALENVELPLYYRSIAAAKRRRLALDALNRVGLSHRMGHFPSQLSGGQQQRVAIARAIASAPPVILADEPTGNLDSHISDEIMQLFCSLHGDGHTIVLITHDTAISRRTQRSICICDGHVIDS